MTWIAPEIERVGGSKTGDERALLQGMLDWYRATLLQKCAGLTGEQLATATVPPSNLTLLGMVRHMTKVERTWFRRRFSGEAVETAYSTPEWKDADFEDLDPANAAGDHARLIEEWKLADAAVARASLDDTFVHDDGEEISLRLIYVHLIAEYARHSGHADLVRERLDGVTGA
ncbi:DinB family protein [Nonomuraea dietziae]|uniref:DinB family protein n=1 Tax=Nonomuraea recticatena TaxID=46178 RepID=A0ABN3SDS6_9ACTN